MLFRIVLLLIVASWPASLYGQSEYPADTLRIQSLNQFLKAVSDSNPNLRASRLTSEALFTKEAQVSAWPDPMVGLTYLPQPIYTARGAQRLQFRAEQLVPFPGKLSLQGEIADLDAVINTLGTDALEDDLILEAKFSYFEIYRLEQHARLIDEFQDKLRDFEQVAATQYEVGLGMQQAILKSQLERNTLSTRLLDIRWQRKSAIEKLANLVNRPVGLDDPIIPISPPAILPLLNEQNLLSQALRNRPELAALDSSASKARKSIDLAQKMFYPDFSVAFSYFDITTSDIPPNADGRNAFGIGFSVKVPLHRASLNARLAETRLNRSRIDVGMESFVSSLRTQIADLLSRLEEDRNQLNLYSNALIPQAETTLEATLSAYTTGRTDFLNLLDAERVLFMVHTGYVDVLVRYLKTTALLERQLGVNAISETVNQ